MMSTLIIVSGGQTGVDRAALDAAIEHDIAHAGWCPAGRRAEDGVIDQRYDLTESESADYRVRTRLNVQDTDGTLIIYQTRISGGSALTEQLCIQLGKPCLVIDIDHAICIEQIVAWMADNTIYRLNVAGPRASHAPAIYAHTKQILTAVIRQRK